jgi:deoxyribonuclease V
MAWPRTVAEAKAIQEKLGQKVLLSPLRRSPRTVAGVDAAFSETHVFGAAVLFTFPGLEPIDEAAVVSEIKFPYVPGYLTFREAPALIRALRLLKAVPDLILVDGQGIAHPRGIGIASHLGVLLDIPTIGCAKSRLIGEFCVPAPEKGSWSRLSYHGEIIGAVLRTRENVRPLYVSPGHRVNLRDSLDIVMACLRNYRIPEPLRRADFLSKNEKRAARKD